MADEPPRPKPVSLKDRIKQFEQSSTSTSSGPAPPPLRPKPGALGQWKPKAADPPSPTKATFTSDSGATGDDHAAAGMSAADAASSIRTGGGSLKERMAALQGKGAFGSSAATSAPPLPSNEGKPRVWRTSPVPPIEPKADAESGDKQEGTEEAQEPSITSPISPGIEQPANTEGGEGEGEPKTEEEEERERRAAIAARMARLGGARVGMPVGFGVASKGLHNKPAPPVKPKILTPGGGDTGSAGTSPLPVSPSAGETEEGEETARKTTLDTALAIPLPKSQGSLLSPGGLDAPSDSDATTSGKLVPPRSPSIPKSPDSMPIPALPKRAAGPRRKKSAKEIKPSSSTESEAAPSIPGEQVQSPPAIEAEPAKDGEYFPEDKNANVEPVSIEQKEEAKEESLDELVSLPASDAATPPPPSPSVGITEDEANEDSDVAPVPTKKPTLEISTSEDHEESIDNHETVLTPKPKEDEDVEETEEERVARKKRVAEKMAQLGGVNPFSPGGFISPASPSGRHVEEPEIAQEAAKDTDDVHEEEDSKHEEDIHEGEDKDVTESAHESKTIPVLSSSDDSQDHDRSAIVSTSIEHTPTQDVYSSSNRSTKASRAEESDQDSALVDDDEVDYPMLSPSGDSRDVSFSAAHGGDVEVAPRGSGEVERSPTHDEEEILSHEERESTPIQESAVLQELENDYEPEASVAHENKYNIDQQEDEEDMRPPRITRAVPPPPSRRPPSVESSPASSTRNSPRNSQFADVNDASPPRVQLVAALARRAPVPPPYRSASSSSSVSPPSSPPATFEREGAPSPPSLRSLSNIEDEDEEEYEEDDSGVLGGEAPSRTVLSEEARSSSPAPMRGPPINRSNNASPAPANRSPPPIPSSRPPVPAVRRSIPPPPPDSPPPRSRPASGRASPALVPGRKSSASDAVESVNIKKAANRPAIPPPRWEEFDTLQKREGEIMDDEEGDPVDPAFVGNRRSSQTSGTSPPPLAPRPRSRTPLRQESLKPEVTEEPTEISHSAEQEEDPEATRRRTIAERMAKLGGIKFGMAPPIRAPPARKATEPRDETDENKHPEPEDNRVEGAQDPDSEQTPEENERSRRAAIAARMAAMGGRGFGMYGAGAVPSAPAIVNNPPSQSALAAAPPRAPLAAPPPVPTSRPHVARKVDAVTDAANRSPPPPPGPSATKGSEHSESDTELVNAEEEEGEMVEEEEDEPELVDTPQLPSRAARPSAHHTSRPPPPVPGQYVPPNEERETTSPPSLPAARRPPPTRAAPPPASPPNEYVDLGGDNSVASLRPTHSRPPPAAPLDSAIPPSLDSSGQWELPNIPSGSFDLSGYSQGNQAPRAVEQDNSWTKVEQEDQPSTSATTTSEPFAGPSPAPIPADRLAALSRTLGPKVLQSAQHVYEKSKRLVIGDGSSTSFLYIVLGPTGASTSSLGHLVYAQNGGNVQKRLGDIMPGDVIALYEAHFKGHKGGLGLSGYSASWGTKEEPVLGIVSEFDGKKSKVRAYAVNQHPNAYPTIDNPSFKLDDLKSGLVKVFRVAADS